MGPESAAVYRRRRLAALGVLAGVAVLAIVLIGSCGSDDKPASAQRLAQKPLLVLDIQPGHADFLSEARRLAPWLGQPDVGIALDPEWHTPGAVPGQQIGSVTAGEINQVSDFVSNIVRADKLPEKLFVIHQFTDGMINGKPQVQPRPGLAMTFNVDGFGDRSNKLAKYG